MGPLGASKVGIIDDKLIANPTLKEIKESTLELVVAGTSQGVLMVESEAQELSEEKMLEAVLLGQKTYKEVIDAIISLAKKAAKDPWEVLAKDEEIKELPLKIENAYNKKFTEAYKIQEKTLGNN